MTDLIAQDKFGGAGIPGQSAHTVAPELEAIITGDSPDTYAVDYPVEQNQDLKALAVVGLNRYGRVVPAEYTAFSEHATGTLTVAAAAVQDDTCSIDGVEYTLRNAPANANQVDVGADEDATAANLAAAINADGTDGAYGAGTVQHPTVYAVAIDAVVHLYARQPGVQGNAIALVETNNRIDRSAATLAGGRGGIRAIGILAQDIETGAGERPSMPVYRAGVYNPVRLIWDDSFGSDDQKKNAFAGAPAPTNILIRAIRAYTLS